MLSVSALWGQSPIPAFPAASYAFQQQENLGIAETVGQERKVGPPARPPVLGSPEGGNASIRAFPAAFPPLLELTLSLGKPLPWPAVTVRPELAKAVLDSLRRTHDDSPLSVSLLGVRGSPGS